MIGRDGRKIGNGGGQRLDGADIVVGLGRIGVNTVGDELLTNTEYLDPPRAIRGLNFRYDLADGCLIPVAQQDALLTDTSEFSLAQHFLGEIGEPLGVVRVRYVDIY